MPNYQLPNFNMTNGSGGLEQLFIYESSQLDIFAPAILLFIFFIITLSGYFSQEKKSGRGNLSMWFAVSMLITTFLAFILFLYNGIINLATLSICVVLSILFTTWFLFDDSGNYN